MTDVLASSTTVTYTDATASGSLTRFYRLRLLP
jgi:hypothetical protein